MSGEIPARLEEYINREAHEQYPKTIGDAMTEYISAALERPDRGVEAEDFRARHGAYLLSRSYMSETKGGQPDGLHVVPIYGADQSQSFLFGPDFYSIIADQYTHNPDRLSFSQYLAAKMKADPGLRKVYDSQMQTTNFIRASKGQPALSESEFDKELCPTENPFGRKYLSVGVVSEALHEGNVDRLFHNADPIDVGLLLSARPEEAAQAQPGNLAFLQEQLLSGLRDFKLKQPEAFAEYWGIVEHWFPAIPRLDTKAHPALPAID